jgi:hypothetical protein
MADLKQQAEARANARKSGTEPKSNDSSFTGVDAAFDTIAGACGEGFAIELTAYLQMFAELPNLDAVLLDPDGAIVPSNPGALYAVTSGIARKITPANAERALRYLGRLPKEHEVCAVRDSLKLNNKLASIHEYTKWFTRNGNILT